MSIAITRTLHRTNVKIGCIISPFNRFGDKPALTTRLIRTTNVQNKSLVQRLSKQLFGRYLLTTNTVGSGVLMVIGDALAQEIEYRRGLHPIRFDLDRIGRMFIVGAMQGPLHHYFYRWMDTIMPVVTMRSVFKKIALDQIVMAPACLVIFFYSAGLLEGKNLTDCGLELRSKFWTIYVVDWLVWPFAQFCNFYWLHPKYRVTYVNVVTALYNVFLSYIKHDEKLKPVETLAGIP